jgi:hypothetical protein
LLAVAQHLQTKETVAVATFLLDPQLLTDAVEAVEFGAVGADVSRVDQILADGAGKDLHQAPILLRNTSHNHCLHTNV